MATIALGESLEKNQRISPPSPSGKPQGREPDGSTHAMPVDRAQKRRSGIVRRLAEPDSAPRPDTLKGTEPHERRSQSEDCGPVTRVDPQCLIKPSVALTTDERRGNARTSDDFCRRRYRRCTRPSTRRQSTIRHLKGESKPTGIARSSMAVFRRESNARPMRRARFGNDSPPLVSSQTSEEA